MQTENKPLVIRTNQLIDYLYKYDDSYHKYEYEEMYRNFLDVLDQLVVDGHNVQLDNFGTFMLKTNPTKEICDPRTGQWYTCQESKTFKFVSSRTMQDKIKRLYKEKVEETFDNKEQK